MLKTPAVTTLPVHLPDSFHHQRHHHSNASQTLSNLKHYFARPEGMLTEPINVNSRTYVIVNIFPAFTSRNSTTPMLKNPVSSRNATTAEELLPCTLSNVIPHDPTSPASNQFMSPVGNSSTFECCCYPGLEPVGRAFEQSATQSIHHFSPLALLWDSLLIGMRLTFACKKPLTHSARPTSYESSSSTSSQICALIPPSNSGQSSDPRFPKILSWQQLAILNAVVTTLSNNSVFFFKVTEKALKTIGYHNL